MYFITSDPIALLEVWERTGSKCFLMRTPENAWFTDSQFPVVEEIGEFFKLVEEDFKIWGTTPRHMPDVQQIATEFLEQVGDEIAIH